MKRLIAAAALAALAITVQPGAAQAAPVRHFVHRNDTGWALTGTQAIALVNATDMGALNPQTPLHVAVALAMRDQAGAQSLLAHESTPGDRLYRTAVTPAQFTAAFNATNAQASAVASYLAQSGFRNVSIEPNNLFVSGYGTAAAAQTAFNTQLEAFQQNGKTVFVNVTPAMVPSAIGGTALAVVGLNNIPMNTFVRHSRHATRPHQQGRVRPNDAPPCIFVQNGLCVVNSYTASGFQIAYDAVGAPTGGGTLVAVFAEGNVAQVLPDLRAYEAFNRLPQVPYTVRRVGLPSIDTAGLIEWDLDTQSSTGIAGSVRRMFVYDTTSLTDSDVALEFNKFTTDNFARAGNASFGLCESFAYVDGSMLADDQVFLEAAAQGQTVFSSTGDNGSGCPVFVATGVPGTGLPEENYPAASPYVVGVGGTTLVTNAADGTYNAEITWIATGGGISAHEYGPYWQNGIVPPAINPPPPGNAVTEKGLPDISMDADPDTGADIINNGQHTGVGGTSLSSPLSMGVWSRLESVNHNKLGFAAPRLYHVYVTNPGGATPPPGATTQLIGGFHDILLGNNGPYPATPRWDFTTGLGTVDVNLMFAAINQ
jgi:subtilase family serine protease